MSAKSSEPVFGRPPVTTFSVPATPRAMLEFLAGLLIALLIGFEASTIWRWNLTRRGWKMLGFVIGEDVEIAEQRFFAEWSKRAVATPPATPDPRYSTLVRRGAPSPSDVIGLFPEPGGSR